MSVSPDAHIELDEDLGPDCSTDPGELWCESGTATNDIHGRRRVRHNSALFEHNSSSGVYGKKSVLGESSSHTGLHYDRRVVDAVAFDTPDLVPPVRPSGDYPPLRPVPPTFVQEPDPQPMARLSRLRSSADNAFLKNTALTMDENAQQGSLDRRLQRNDMGGSGSAVARARRRLSSFRTTRENVSSGGDVSTDQHESRPRPKRSSAHQQTMPKSRDTLNTILKALKDVRFSLAEADAR